MEKKYTQITQEQREEIYHQHADGISPTEIAWLVGLDRSTIYRELKRNSYLGKTYSPDAAHMMALKRRNRPGTKMEILFTKLIHLIMGLIISFLALRGL